MLIGWPEPGSGSKTERRFTCHLLLCLCHQLQGHGVTAPSRCRRAAVAWWLTIGGHSNTFKMCNVRGGSRPNSHLLAPPLSPLPSAASPAQPASLGPAHPPPPPPGAPPRHAKQTRHVGRMVNPKQITHKACGCVRHGDVCACGFVRMWMCAHVDVCRELTSASWATSAPRSPSAAETLPAILHSQPTITHEARKTKGSQMRPLVSSSVVSSSTPASQGYRSVCLLFRARGNGKALSILRSDGFRLLGDLKRLGKVGLGPPMPRPLLPLAPAAVQNKQTAVNLHHADATSLLKLPC